MIASLLQHRRSISGVLLALMMLVTLYLGFFSKDLSFKDVWPSGLLAMVAAILLLPDTKPTQRIQLSVLVLAGVLLLSYALMQGVVVRWPEMMSQNTGLLTMLFAVGLLKLIVTTAASAKQKLPIGRTAFLHTILTVTTFGSVINISALIVVADRLSLNRPLNYFAAGSAVRSFSACAAWSPFFAGMAVVLTAVGEEHLLSIMALGLPLTIAFVALLYFSGVFLSSDKVDAFHGYPMKLESFLVPSMLTAMVIILSVLAPGVHILSAIAISSIALTLVLLSVRQGFQKTANRLGEYVCVDIPKMVGELQLFLSAGVLAFGLQALVQTGIITVPIDAFTGVSACVLLAILLIFATLGVHPIILIASLTPIIEVVDPDPVLLGLSYLFGWSLGTCISPLSGTNLVMQGRFGINALRGALQNMPYVAVMYCIACVILLLRAMAIGAT